jgi:glycosyltransferase involved in cell wall biosynthesis
MFLARTVQGVLDAIRGDTEIIVVLDGAWADPQLPVDERVSVIYNHEAVGQRAATNQAARLAQGKWLMKLDAHCSVDEGFDVKLLAGAEEDWTLVPTMYNLHAFDRVCWAAASAVPGAEPI